VTFAFSIRLLPLYMRLPVIDWSTRRFAFFYGVVAIAGLTLQIPPVLRSDLFLLQPLSHFFLLLKSSAFLWFIFRLGVLHLRRELLREELDTGWTAASWTRDIEQFGPFHKLIRASFAWLLVGAFCEFLQGVCGLANVTLPVSSDAVRHIYLLGFATHLLLGISVRMLPGFMGRKAIARPRLVSVMFWLVSTAAFTRILPILVPASVILWLPGGTRLAQAALGTSGLFGIAAIALLALNLARTANPREGVVRG